MKKNTLQIYLPPHFSPVHSPESCDVVSLYQQKQWALLNDVVICNDLKGNITARFGHSQWDLEPLRMTKNCTHKRINFSALSTTPALMVECKLFCYGWLFNASTQYSHPTKISTVISRASGLKKTYEFLALNNLSGLAELSEPVNLRKYLEFLRMQEKSAGTIVHILCAVQQAWLLFPWMGVTVPPVDISPTKLSKKLCRPGATEREQTIVIPEAIADKLLKHAVHLIETAWPYRHQLGETECALQKNYEQGEEQVRARIRSGQWKWLTQEKHNRNFRHDFAKEANYLAPGCAKDIIAKRLGDYPLFHPEANGIWWHDHRASLMAAGFICCAAFSGMRESELFELTPDSYYSALYNGRTFHFLKAKTHKTGERHTEWVVAPVVQKVIELVTALTAHMRTCLLRNATTLREREWAHCLWLSQGQRSTQPKLITSWCIRLSNFAKAAGIVVSEADYTECIRSNPNSTNRIKKLVRPGAPWLLTPHQFRRTLAFFTIKNRLGNAIAIKQQYKHLYLQMSEWYCEGGLASRLEYIESDKEFQKLLNTLHDEQITNQYWSWLHGKEILAGSYGKDILQLRGDLPSIYSSREKLYKLVKEKRLTLHGTLHSYCKNGYDCDMGGVINPAFCVNCQSHGSIITGEQALWWQKKHRTLTNYLSDTPDISPAISTHCLTQIRAAEKVMTDFDIGFTRWETPTEG